MLLIGPAALWADDAGSGTNRLTLDITVAECEPQLLDKLPETTAQRMSPESLAQHNPAAPLFSQRLVLPVQGRIKQHFECEAFTIHLDLDYGFSAKGDAVRGGVSSQYAPGHGLLRASHGNCFQVELGQPLYMGCVKDGKQAWLIVGRFKSATTVASSVSPAPATIPHVATCPSVFTGPADGYDGFLLRRLTEDRKASIQLKIDYARLQGAIPATTNRLVWHTVNIAEHPDTVSCWIEEYGGPADEFLWNHRRRPSAVSAKWTCASGQVLFRLGEPERMEKFGYFATFVVSHLQVAGPTTGFVERVSFDDVRVGWEGID